MFEYLPLNDVGSSGPEARRLVLLGLSTCAFCSRAKRFLDASGLAFAWIHLDMVPAQLKDRAKEEFLSRFGTALSYPTLVMDGKDFLPGFIEPLWRDELDSFRLPTG